MLFQVYTVEERSFTNLFGVKEAWEVRTHNCITVDVDSVCEAFEAGQKAFGKDANIRIDDVGDNIYDS